MTNGESPAQMGVREAIGWCQFLYSLIVRTPEHLAIITEKLKTMDALAVVESIRDIYPNIRGPKDPETFDEYKAAFALNPIEVPATRVLPKLIGSKRVIRELASFQWRTATVETAEYPLLASDRPVIMTDGLRRPDAHIVLPIAPRRLCIATRNEESVSRPTSSSMALMTGSYVLSLTD